MLSAINAILFSFFLVVYLQEHAKGADIINLGYINKNKGMQMIS